MCVTLVAAGFDSTGEQTLTAQVETPFKPMARPEKTPAEPRFHEPRVSDTRTSDSRFLESRPTERKASNSTLSETGWDKPKESQGTPRRKGGDDELEVPSFLR